MVIDASVPICPVPDNANGQFTPPGRLADPLTVTGSDVPTSWPAAVPEIVMPPEHVAENWPPIDVEVWLEIVHCTLSHDGDPGMPGTTPLEVYAPATVVDGVVPAVVELGAVTEAVC
jgi:hypothetical protein